MYSKPKYSFKISLKGDNVMKYFTVLFLVYTLLLNCGSEELDTQRSYGKYGKDVNMELLSLEWTIGGENDQHKEEFLLVKPRFMNVNHQGDILVADEFRIKVFDNNGDEKKIVGRVGLGPAEFSRSHVPYLGPEGYLIVVDDVSTAFSSDFYKSRSELSNYYNLFTPDYTFIEKKRFVMGLRLEEYLQKENIDSKYFVKIAKIIPLSKAEKVYEIELEDQQPDADIKYYAVILYENADTIIPLLYTKLTESPNVLTPYPLGELHWELLHNRKVIYVDSNEDTYNEQTGSFYTIHLLSLDGQEEKQIIREFTPVEYPESLTHPQIGKGASESFRRRMEQRAKAYRDKMYNPSIQRMKVDGNYAFMFTYVKNDDNAILTDVLDLEAGKYVTSVYFQFIPAVIKSGYAYYITTDEKGFAEIMKYKINPAVYEK